MRGLGHQRRRVSVSWPSDGVVVTPVTFTAFAMSAALLLIFLQKETDADVCARHHPGAA